MNNANTIVSRPAWVVRAGQDSDRYLQDLGSLKTKEAPYGGPGCFGPLETVQEFKTLRDAKQAQFGLLGYDGRRAEAVKKKV